MKGYSHRNFAESFAEFGDPRELPLCGGWILERPIPGFSYRDAMGCYPLFVCRDWLKLGLDLKNLEGDLVSLSLVADPFGQHDEALLKEYFDVVIPFKEHFVTDLTIPMDLPRHLRRYVPKAFENVCVDICEDPIRYLDEWTDLYNDLTKRFDAKGVRAFSKAAFAKQLSIPGAVLFRALHNGTAIAAHLFYFEDEVCYGHLAAFNSIGRDLMASYALYWTEIEYFSDKAHWIDWGGSAGIKYDRDDGLAKFKRGWSTETRIAYFCGRIFNRERYDEIVKVSAIAANDYFPAYRKGEFG